MPGLLITVLGRKFGQIMIMVKITEDPSRSVRIATVRVPQLAQDESGNRVMHPVGSPIA